MDIEKIWNTLEKEAGESAMEGTGKWLLMPELNQKIFLGYRSPGNIRMLLLIVKKKNLPSLPEFPDLKGLRISFESFPEEGESYASISLMLTNSIFKDIFTVLVQDLINRIIIEQNQNQMIKSFFTRLHQWRTFLEKYGVTGLNTEEQRGLFGELWIIREYLFSRIGKKAAIYAWKGPFRAPQDFIYHNTGLEVKTTISRQPRKIKITSELQLDNSAFENLFLIHVLLGEDTRTIETLPDLINKIKKLLYEECSASEMFEKALFESGYLAVHEHEYQKTSYSVRGINIYHVKDKFPRITRNEIPDGIEDIHYSVNLSECRDYRIGEDEFFNVLESVNEYR